MVACIDVERTGGRFEVEKGLAVHVAKPYPFVRNVRQAVEP